MRTMIWNLFILEDTTTLVSRPPLKIHCGYESRGGHIQAGIPAAAAIPGITTETIAFCF